MAPSRASSLENTGATRSACRAHPSSQVQSAPPRAICLVAATASGPFAAIVARYNHDFYAVDPHLFSPA